MALMGGRPPDGIDVPEWRRWSPFKGGVHPIRT